MVAVSLSRGKCRARWFVNLRIMTKFLLILFMAFLMLLGATILLQRIPFSAYDEQLYKSSTQMMSLFQSNIQAELNEMENLSYRILTDSLLQNNLMIMKSFSPGTTDWVKAKSEVNERMSYYTVWPNNVRTMQLMTDHGYNFSYVFGDVRPIVQLTDQHIQKAAEAEGRPVWIIEEGDPARIFIVRQIRQMSPLTLSPLATELIQFDLAEAVERNLAVMEDLDCPLACAIYADDLCLYTSDPALHCLPEAEDGYERLQLNGWDSVCVRYTGENGWRYVILLDYTKIDATLDRSIRLSLALNLLVALGTLLLAALLMNSILRHLKLLLDKFDAFAISGKPAPDADDSPYLNRRDEIGKLHRHFDRMIRDYDRMIRSSYEQERLLQETRIQQLRAQVRPHFLYNTLESIYCLAVGNQDQRIATMTDALGKMLRASLNDQRDMTTLGDDLRIVREYMRIQEIRYGERIRMCYDVPDALLASRIPSMTLQPLVENAIHHAAEEMLDTCVIRIVASQVGDEVQIAISDNGPGIDEDILEKLESGEIKPEGMGIGMRNINDRLRYAFAGVGRLTVRRLDGWTSIIIHLPG